MRSLNTEGSGTVRTLYLGEVNPAIHGMACDDNLEIFFSVILSVLFRAKRVFFAFVVNQFPGVQITANILRHYKAVLCNISPVIGHWKEEIPWLNLEQNVTTAGSLPKFPVRRTMNHFAMMAPLSSGLTSSHPVEHPTCLATTKTSGKDILVAPVFCAKFLRCLNGAYLFHSYNLPYAQKLRKGEANS